MVANFMSDGDLPPFKHNVIELSEYSSGFVVDLTIAFWPTLFGGRISDESLWYAYKFYLTRKIRRDCPLLSRRGDSCQYGDNIFRLGVKNAL